MDAPRRTPSDAELVELHDRLWNDPRSRDDRSQFFECDACGGPIRWIANLGSARGGSIQVVARPVATAAFFDPFLHAGLVAVWPDRTGFTVGRATEASEVDGAFLYRCHWDTCDHARALRDRMSRERTRSNAAAAAVAVDDEVDPELVRRYAAWRDAQEHPPGG
jgi:hypothetical protein